MQDKFDYNIGSVIYSETPEGINAKWIFKGTDQVQHGTGEARRLSVLNEDHRFEGEFEITYIDQNGYKSPTLNLVITFISDYYHLAWKTDDQLTDIGIGMENEGKLIASYKKAD